MANILAVGQTVPLSIAYLDQNGQPMQTPPTPDAPPTWQNTTPATETLTVDPGNLTASVKGAAPGTDTVSVNVTVGGKPFSAQLVDTVTPAPQVLTSIEIIAGAPQLAAAKK